MPVLRDACRAGLESSVSRAWATYQKSPVGRIREETLVVFWKPAILETQREPVSFQAEVASRVSCYIESILHEAD